MHHAHARGLVHRDIKPSNILIDSSGRPVVADFGLALRDEDLDRYQGLAGTPAYMSPEQVKGEGHRVDGRSDIFSLGVVFYELLTGRRPFSTHDRDELLQLIATTEPCPPRQIDVTVPKELERICLRAIAKRATDRYATARDMADDVMSFLRTVPPKMPMAAAAKEVATSGGPTQQWTPASSTQSDRDPPSIKVIPKGLRSFDEHDADFFLDLLPGPRSRDGLPESIRFWKSRIETTEPANSFSVGLIYGPSGCGKSSLVKAGLLPRLAKHVLPIYIEATAAETETRLLKSARKACFDLPDGLGLVDSLAAVRKGRILRSGQKLLLVIDQFEQWLHAKRCDQGTELVAALRQCDSEHVSALLMVRDDFWMATTRLMAELEVELIQGHNMSAVDLFDPRHARNVLMAFGTAYGNLPERKGDISGGQDAFLNHAIGGLVQDGKIISVRLALFAEMVKARRWELATLREMGGTEGVGVAFLEETFNSPRANPKHRLHEKAARTVLKKLLPDSGTAIKGRMQSEFELQNAAACSDRPRDFAELIHILDSELRLITPTEERMKDEGERRKEEPQAESTSDSSFSLHPSSFRYFQLTHDYLVPSLRDWLHRKERETRRGRAALRLTERAALWNAKPENRHMPSIVEWASIRVLTPRRSWTESEERMMKRAGRVHGLRAFGVTAALVAALLVGIDFRRRVALANDQTRAAGLVEQVVRANITEMPAIVESMAGYRRWANPMLREMLSRSPEGSPERLRASLALLPVDDGQIDGLCDRLLEADADTLPVLCDALKPHRARLIVPKLWPALEAARPGDSHLLPVASALADYDPEDARWKKVAGGVAEAVVTVNAIYLRSWLDALRPVHQKLVSPLAAIFGDKDRSESDHTQATIILGDYAGDNPAAIAELLMRADPKAYRAFFPIVERQKAATLPLLHAEIDENSAISWRDQLFGSAVLAAELASGSLPLAGLVWLSSAPSEQAKDQLAARQARAAVALVRLGHADQVWPLLRHSPDPRVRSFIIHWLKPLSANATAIAAEFAQVSPKEPANRAVSVRREFSDPTRAPDPRFSAGFAKAAKPGRPSVRPVARSGDLATTDRPARPLMDAILFHPETSIRRALIQALGSYSRDAFSTHEREALTAEVLDLFQNDPDSGIHSAAEWALRQWNEQATLKLAEASLPQLENRGGRRWFVNSQRQTFAMIEGPVEFTMGSPPDEPDHDAIETPERRRIPYRFAIAAKEVSFTEFHEFLKDYPDLDTHRVEIARYAQDPDAPMIGVNWLRATAYCNWLSRKENLLDCYEPNEKQQYGAGMRIRSDARDRSGYRLPSEAEWEYCCRSGTLTSRYFGLSVNLLPNYARYRANSKNRTWPRGYLLPNDLGLFDMLGNAYEWGEERDPHYRPLAEKAAAGTIVNPFIIDINTPRLIFGGAFDCPPEYVRSADRGRSPPGILGWSFGFRPVRTCL